MNLVVCHMEHKGDLEAHVGAHHVQAKVPSVPPKYDANAGCVVNDNVVSHEVRAGTPLIGIE